MPWDNGECGGSQGSAGDVLSTQASQAIPDRTSCSVSYWEPEPRELQRFSDLYCHPHHSPHHMYWICSWYSEGCPGTPLPQPCSGWVLQHQGWLRAAQRQGATPEQQAGPGLWEGAFGMRKSWELMGFEHLLGKQRSSGMAWLKGLDSCRQE